MKKSLHCRSQNSSYRKLKVIDVHAKVFLPCHNHIYCKIHLCTLWSIVNVTPLYENKSLQWESGATQTPDLYGIFLTVSIWEVRSASVKRQVTHSWERSNLLGVRCRWWNMFLIPLHSVFFFGSVLSPSTIWSWPRARVYSSGPITPPDSPLLHSELTCVILGGREAPPAPPPAARLLVVN